MSGKAHYLQPSKELVTQSRKFAESWKQVEAKNEPLKAEGVKLDDKPFYHYNDAGEADRVGTVNIAINKVSNTQNKPDVKLSP